MRFDLSLRNPATPLRSSIIRPKKPAIRKNNGMRNMWMVPGQRRAYCSAHPGSSTAGPACTAGPHEARSKQQREGPDGVEVNAVDRSMKLAWRPPLHARLVCRYDGKHTCVIGTCRTMRRTPFAWQGSKMRLSGRRAQPR